ncbi:MAG: M23 family metallopeptidase [Acidobacteriota bacterium]
MEVQIHSSNSRCGVRTLRLTAPRLRVLAIVALLWSAGLILAAVVAPRVLGGLLEDREYGARGAERSRLGERLRGLVAQMTSLEAQAEAARHTLVKLHLAFGLKVPRHAASGTALPVPPPRSIYSDTVAYGQSLEQKTEQELGTLSSLFADVEGYEVSHRVEIPGIPAASPLRGGDFVLISTFGIRRSVFTGAMEFHSGIDLAAAVGTPVRAPADGQVVFAGRIDMQANAVWWRFGNLVIVRHAAGYTTVFAHLDEVRARTGQRLRRGDVLGTVGNSGWSSSPHLHYEVRIPGASGWRPIEPRLFILDHHWDDEEEVLARGRHGPVVGTYEPLPSGAR